MLVEQCAYGNRWRQVSPAAKAVFSLCGLIAAFVARAPLALCAMVGIFAGITVFGAEIPVRHYVRVALAPLSFLCTGAATLAVSVVWQDSSILPSLQLDPAQLQRAAVVCTRSLDGLAALLFLSLTTPMTDLIALLRRLRVPGALLDTMTLCYRTLFVFLEVLHDTLTAQAARLGYSTPRHAMRSLGGLVANFAIQVWQRSHALHVAALSRNNDGPLRFLEREYPRAGRDFLAAVGGGFCLIAFALATVWISP